MIRSVVNSYYIGMLALKKAFNRIEINMNKEKYDILNIVY